MNPIRLIPSIFVLFLVSVVALAQDKTSTEQSRHKSQGLHRMNKERDSLTRGMKLIYSSPDEDWEERLDMDLKDLDVTINAAVAEAMKSVDAALRDLDIDIPEIDMDEVDVPEIHIPEVEIPAINIHIPDLHDMDMDIHHNHFNWDKDDDSKNRDEDKVNDRGHEKVNNTAKEKDKEKKKGLVKVK